MSERYQREIEEILRQAGEQGGRRRRGRPKRNLFRFIGSEVGKSLGGKKLSLSPGRLMLISVVVLLSALILRATSSGLVAPLVWAGLLLFIVAYALFFVKPRAPLEKRWRGQLIEEPIPSWWLRLRSWLKK